MPGDELPPEVAWPGGIAAVTLLVDDLEGAKRLYENVSDLPVWEIAR